MLFLKMRAGKKFNAALVKDVKDARQRVDIKSNSALPIPSKR